MSATKTRMPLAEATELAWEAVQLVLPTCRLVKVAGSIRRQRPTIGDIELVCIPLYGEASRDLFNKAVEPGVNLLDLACDRLFVDGTLGKRYDKNGRPRWGSGLKWATFRDVPLDIFTVVGDTAQWGVILLLRTGSAAFSKRLVTPIEKGGWMPAGMCCDRGALWRDGVLVPTPDERSVFAAIGRGFIPPEEREVPS